MVGDFHNQLSVSTQIYDEGSGASAQCGTRLDWLYHLLSCFVLFAVAGRLGVGNLDYIPSSRLLFSLRTLCDGAAVLQWLS
jgi:hypothetical protein